MVVRQIRTLLLLADIPHNRNNNLSCRICDVQQICQEFSIIEQGGQLQQLTAFVHLSVETPAPYFFKAE